MDIRRNLIAQFGGRVARAPPSEQSAASPDLLSSGSSRATNPFVFRRAPRAPRSSQSTSSSRASTLLSLVSGRQPSQSRSSRSSEGSDGSDPADQEGGRGTKPRCRRPCRPAKFTRSDKGGPWMYALQDFNEDRKTLRQPFCVPRIGSSDYGKVARRCDYYTNRRFRISMGYNPGPVIPNPFSVLNPAASRASSLPTSSERSVRTSSSAASSARSRRSSVRSGVRVPPFKTPPVKRVLELD